MYKYNTLISVVLLFTSLIIILDLNQPSDIEEGYGFANFKEKVRVVFRTESNTYDEVFSRK